MSENRNRPDEIIEKKTYGFWAFTPLLVFLLIYIGGGIVFTFMGRENPFKQIPREASLLVGIVVALIMNRKMKVEDKVEMIARNAGQTGVMSMVLIFLVAGAFSGVCSAIGGADSVVNMGLTFIPKRFLVAGIFVVASFLSTAMGTSTGTVVALSPIAVAVSRAAGISPAIALAAMSGGSMFGDNLSVISDTTIAATKGVGAEMRDKFKMNFLIAIPAAIMAIIAYSMVPVASQNIGKIGAYHFIYLLPYVAVLVTALMGMNVLVALFIGIGIAGVIGLAMGTISILGILQAVGSGLNDMLSIAIACILIRGLIGIIHEYGGIEWLIQKILKFAKSRRTAEYCIAFLSAILSIALANNTMAIIISAPLAKEIGENYHIAPKRTASLLDIFSCVLLEFAPHTGSMVLLTSLAECSPVDIFKGAYYAMALGICTIITIQFGLLRTKEEKEYDSKLPTTPI